MADDNKPRRFLTGDGRVVNLKPYLQPGNGSTAYTGAVLAPWDCRCPERTKCICSSRPVRPPPEAVAIAEAEAFVAKLQAGIAEAKAEVISLGAAAKKSAEDAAAADKAAGAALVAEAEAKLEELRASQPAPAVEAQPEPPAFRRGKR